MWLQAPHDLRALLSPTTRDEFFSSHWERQHLHLRRGQSDFYSSLVTTQDLEQILSHPDARYPGVQLARGGHYLAPESFTREVKVGGDRFTDVIDPERVSREYRNGASVVLPAIHRLHRPLAELCQRIHDEISHVVHANAYLTPGCAQGFTPHYDTHDVLVLQIAGSKRWQLYPGPVTLPHRSQPFEAVGYSPPAPSTDIELVAGDLLYLPRGTVHSAETGPAFSAHVSIGITVYTWADLTRDLLEVCIQDEDSRRALPVGFSTHDELRPQLEKQLQQALEKLRTGADFNRHVERFVQRVRATRISVPESFHADVCVITAQTRLEVSRSAQYRIALEPGATVLEFGGKRHLLPPAAAPALRALSVQAGIQATDLPGDLNPESKLGLVRYLQQIGLLTTSAK